MGEPAVESKDDLNELRSKKRKLNEDEGVETAKKVKVDQNVSPNGNAGERKKKNKKKKSQNQQQGGGGSISLQSVAAFYNKSNAANKKNSFRNKSKKGGSDAESFSVDRLKAYGINPLR